MKFLVLFAAVCIGAAAAELSQQLEHEKEMVELCKERGVFANPHDPEHRTFIRCELEPVELQCDEEFIFDAEKLMCVEKPQPPAPVDLNAVAWQDVLACPDVEDKYFRNPYDCSRFYRCYKQGEFSRLDIGTCLPTMIFDEVLETCLPIDTFKSYYGQECANAPLPDLNKKDETPVHHEETPVEPENPNTHEENPFEPETPDHHEETPVEPENPDTHHETPVEPENPNTHEENPFEPETPDHHDETPVEPENPDTHHETPVEPENPDTHHETPVEPENPDTHHETPVEPENPDTHHETPVEPENPDTHHETPVEPEPVKKQPSLEDILKQIKNAFGNL